MKAMIRTFGAVTVGISLLAASSALAGGGYGGGHGGGGYGGYHGGGYYGGYHGGYGWGGLGFAVGFGWPYYYDYAPQTVVYSAQPEVIYTSPTVNYSPQPSAPTPTAAPSVQYQPVQPNTQQQPSMTVADIKALATGGLSDVVILSQIRSHHAVFNLSTEEIIDLNTSKVSQKVIEAMINTGGQH